MKSQSTPLPLRSSVVWGGYREAVLLPHRYGYTAGTLIQYDAARTQFLAADHPCISVDDVLQDEQSIGGWVLRNTVDNTGHPIALVVFDRAIEEGAELVARMRGKPHPTTGALMVNPADVVLDILAGISGRAVTAAQLEPFRRACDREQLDVGGSITDADSDQTVIRGLVGSIGGIYCADMPALCKLWPGITGSASKLTVRDGDVAQECDLDDIVNQLTIRFAYEGDTPRASVVLEAPDSVARYGARPSTLEARWLTSARVAVAVGIRLLGQQARPVWLVSASTKAAIDVGDTVTFEHPALSESGDAIALSREVAFDTGVTAFTARMPAGDAPVVRLVSQSAAYSPTQYPSDQIETQGGSRIITLLDSDGRTPLAGAQVTLDGGTQVRQTDGAGKVAFPVDSMPPGLHTLHIVTADGRAFDYPVVVQ